MAEPSRTTWPDYAVRPVMCSACGHRVTLKHYWLCYFDATRNRGYIWHWHCGPLHNKQQLPAA